MSRAAPVDREKEIALFREMIAGKIGERILLIQAGSGMGKTILLEKFIEHSAEAGQLAYINFKDSNLSLPELFSELCDALGANNFKHLNELISSNSDAPISIANNTLSQSSQLNVYLSASNETDYERQRAALTDAFLNDLDQLGNTTLIFDTLNACDGTIRSWFAGIFLSRASRRKQLTVVLAGQEVPQPEGALKTKCIMQVLESIQPKDWLSYAQQLKLDCTLDWIDGFCRALQGNSLTIANMLESEAKRGQTR